MEPFPQTDLQSGIGGFPRIQMCSATVAELCPIFPTEIRANLQRTECRRHRDSLEVLELCNRRLPEILCPPRNRDWRDTYMPLPEEDNSSARNARVGKQGTGDRCRVQKPVPTTLAIPWRTKTATPLQRHESVQSTSDSVTQLASAQTGGGSFLPTADVRERVWGASELRGAIPQSSSPSPFARLVAPQLCLAQVASAGWH